MYKKLLLFVAVCLLFPLITYAQAPVIPVDASTGVSQGTPAVTWTDFDDGFGFGLYDAEFDNDPLFGSVDASVAATPATLLVLPALSYNTAYYWRVRDTDINGGGLDGPWHAYSFTTEIATPVLTAPANAAPGQPTSVNLTWTLAGGTAGVTFDLEYHTGGGFPGTIVAGVSSPHAFSGLSNNTTYSWRIIAKKAGEADKTSSTFTFSTVPPAPTLTSPANYVVGVTVLPTLSWTGVGTSYDFEIDNNSDFSSPVATQSSGATSYAFTPYVSTATIVLSNGTLYYWRVRQTNANGTSAWASREFTTVSAATPQINISVLGTTAYITWYPLPYATGLKYDVYYSTASNMSGYSTAVSGTTSQYYSLSGLAAGTTYYVQIVSYTGSGPYVYYTFSAVSSFTTGGIPTIYPSYPTGGATAYSNPPTVYYYAGSYFSGLQYQVRYGTSSTDTTPADGEMDSGTNLSLTSDLYKTFPSSLTAGTTYYWQVRGYDPVGLTYGAWSSIESFVMYSSVPAAPIVPYLSYPIGGVTTYINPPSLYWYLGQYATGLEFYVQWDDASDFATPLGNSGWITNLYYTLTSSLADGTYYWRVKSRLAATLVESAYSSTESFVLSDPYSGATVPTPTYPIGGITVYTLSPTLGWYAYSTSTLEFEIKVAPYSNVDGNGMLNHATVTTYTWQTASTLGISGLSAGATYYWQVRSRLQATPATVSAWSSVVSFATAAGALSIVPQIADIVSPNHGQPINNTTALLSWKLQSQPESHIAYQVEYSKTEDFNNSIKVNGINEPFVKVGNLEANSKYYWRVNSSTNNITQPVYSSVGSFSTGGNITDVEENIIPNQYSLEQNYPNPFNPTTKITYSLPQNSFVALKIYDILGREVKTLINNEVNAGSHSVVWNGTDNYGNKVSSGTYIYRVVAGDFVSVKKMILIK